MTTPTPTFYLSVDIETTGFPRGSRTDFTSTDIVDDARMIAIGIVLADEKENIIQTYHNLVKPDNFTWIDTPIDETNIRKPCAFDTHGITNHMAQTQGVDITRIFNDIKPFLEQATHILGYNIKSCDSIILSREFIRYGRQDLFDLFHSKPRIDVMEMFKTVPNRADTKKFNLNICFEYCMTIPRPPERMHNALHDAEDTMRCFFILKNLTNTQPSPPPLLSQSPPLITITI